MSIRCICFTSDPWWLCRTSFPLTSFFCTVFSCCTWCLCSCWCATFSWPGPFTTSLSSFALFFTFFCFTFSAFFAFSLCLFFAFLLFGWLFRFCSIISNWKESLGNNHLILTHVQTKVWMHFNMFIKRQQLWYFSSQIYVHTLKRNLIFVCLFACLLACLFVC